MGRAIGYNSVFLYPYGTSDASILSRPGVIESSYYHRPIIHDIAKNKFFCPK